MQQRDLAPFSVTPAATLLSRCVAVGAVSQEELDSAFSDQRPIFSLRLQEAEQQIRKLKQLDEVQLQLEQLKVEEQSADVAHGFHLGQKKAELQLLGDHLQSILREHKALRQRLMWPLAHTNLPVAAHLQPSVVDCIKLMMDFIECLEDKLRSTQNQAASSDRLALLDGSLALMLTLAAESETLLGKIQQWRSASSSSSCPGTSEPQQRSPATAGLSAS